MQTLSRATSRDAAVHHGVFGGFSPEVVVFFSTVCVVVPPESLVVTWDFVLASSEQPEIPIPKPVNRTPIISVLVSLRMAVAPDLENRGGQ
jgi:hypothetical protein